MDRDTIYRAMSGDGSTDYEIYLNTRALFECQKPFDSLCNGDELQFQIVHQAQELWMKLIIYTLLDIDEYLRLEESHRVLTLFHRVHRVQHHMIGVFSLLNTMSPREYQEIRVGLGNGSGQESPGFRTLMGMAGPLWHTYEAHYLQGRRLTLEQIYHTAYSHGPEYRIAEAFAEYDQLFQRFRFHHLQHIRRSIGLGSKSLKGRPVKLLEDGLQHLFFPQLWKIRDSMTNTWSTTHGEVRDSIGPHGDDKV